MRGPKLAGGPDGAAYGRERFVGVGAKGRDGADARCSAAPNHVLCPEVKIDVRKTRTCFQLFDFEHLIIPAAASGML
jgi:hypothetical protein